MKKTFLYSALILIATALFSCKSGESYTIKMQLKPGDRFAQQIKSNMVMEYNVMGMKMGMKMGMDASSQFDVLKSTENEKELKMTFTEYSNTMKMEGMPETVNMDSILKENESTIVGKSLTFKMSKDNEITDVAGFETMMDTTRFKNEKSKEFIKKTFTKEKMKDMWGMLFSMYPNKPVKVGESWKSKSTMNISGFDMKVNMTYTLQSVENGIASIKLAGIIDGKGKIDQMPMEMDMKGKQNGMIQIKMADGYLKEGNYDMEMTAEMEIAGQKMPISMKGNYLMKGK